MTTRAVCFRVDGGWLADFARTRFDEGAWDRALTMLTESLEGLSTDQAIAILKGEADLVGDSSDEDGIQFKELGRDSELAIACAKRAEYMYGNLFRLGDTIWKPYAIVSGWCRDDYEFALAFTGQHHVHGGRDQKLGSLRSLFYANKPNDDMLVHIPQRFSGSDVIADVLCERFVGSVPFWYKVSAKDPITFIEDYLDRQMLPMRGAFRNGYGDRVGTTMDPASTPNDIATTAAEIEAATDRVSPAGAFGDTPAERGKEKMNDAEARALFTELLDATEKYLAEETPEYDELREMDRIFEKGIDALHRFVTSDQWDRVEVARERFTTKREQFLSTQVRAQAEQNGGFFELPLLVHDEHGDEHPWSKQRFLRVPRNPFILWCLRYFDFVAHGHEQPTWNFVAGIGWKMSGDDPYHTDWMLGAGVPLDQTYEHDEDKLGRVVRDSAYWYRDKIIREFTGHQFTVLAKSKHTYFSGDIVFPEPNARVAPGSIAVVPHAGPEYQLAMETANMENSDGRRGCIICEVGGKLAHLAIVGREFKCTVLMLPGAMKMYKPGNPVRIDLTEGIIESQIL